MKKLLLYTIFSVVISANDHKHTDIHDDNDISNTLPHISLIIDTSYVKRNVDDKEAPHLEIPDIAHGLLASDENDKHSHSINNSDNGFNFNYVELLLSKQINAFINFESIFHFTSDTAEIDELYINSPESLYDLNFKIGKFRSSFGYLNQFHHHSYNFTDMPLVYEAFLGSHGLNEVGLQLEYQLPISNVKIGIEILEGKNEQMFGNDAIQQIIDAKKAPSMYVVYLKNSFENNNLNFLGGLSFANGTSKINHLEDEEPQAFDGKSQLYGLDMLLKYHLNNHSMLSWQSEVISRRMKGDTYTYDTSKNLINTQTDSSQSGLYTQLVYEYNEHWSNGIRYENIYKNSLDANMDKYSIELTYSPIESTYFRVQYSRNNALYDEDLNQQKIDTLTIQANFTIGYHKAHKHHEKHQEEHDSLD